MTKSFEYLSVKELAKLLGWSYGGTRKRVRSGAIKHEELMGRIVIFPEHIRESFPEAIAEKILEAAREQGLLNKVE